LVKNRLKSPWYSVILIVLLFCECTPSVFLRITLFGQKKTGRKISRLSCFLFAVLFLFPVCQGEYPDTAHIVIPEGLPHPLE